MSREKRTAAAWALLTLSLVLVLPLADDARSAPASEGKPVETASKAPAKGSTKKAAPHAKSATKSETKSATKPETKPETKLETKSSTKTGAASPAKAGGSGDKGHPAAASHPKSAAKPTGPNTRPAPSPHRTPASLPAQATVHPSAPIAALAYAAPATTGIPLAAATTAWTSPADIDAVRQAIALVQANRGAEAGAVERGISDPLARKLVEWVILRSDETDADFARYHAFIAANPGWPSIVTFRRRAEAMLWQERAPPATVRAYFTGIRPLSAKGRFALARALLLDGDRAGAQALVREAWRADPFSQDLENQALELFGDLITRADDKVRMDRRLYAADEDAGLRAAKRLGGDQPAIAKARIAVNARAGNAKNLLDEVPVAARNDAGYIFSAVQWLRRRDRFADAAAMLMRAPRDPAQLQDADEWWVERRLVARKLLDLGDPRLAYAIVRDAAKPAKGNYRAEHQFTAGWIALRFLKEPAIAAYHFAHVAEGNANPITISRAGYWLGRTAELANRPQEARAYYETAARYGTAYYGQLARARLGRGELSFAAPPVPAEERRQLLSRLEVVRALTILYAVDARDLAAPFVADLADKSVDQAALAMLAEIAEKHGDARAVLLIGKMALGRGFPFDHYAFPVGGLPRYSTIGPAVEPAVVYSIARQESAFNPKTVSSANALGLMQVTPDAGRYIAKKFGVAFDQRRLLHDTVYNTQMGAAELGDDIEHYRGSYILAFAAYNAGAGRVKEWIERYGDPRDPRVDPIDWVERIPFSETRNYVQRILENLQVYRARFGGSSRLMIEADLRRGTQAD